MKDLPEEFIDLLYYHMLMGTPQLEITLFRGYLKRLPESRRRDLEVFIESLISGDDEASKAVADVFVSRVLDTAKGAQVMLPLVIETLVSSDLRFDTKIASKVAEGLIEHPRFAKTIVDTLVSLALNNEREDAYTFRQSLEILKHIKNEELSQTMFVNLARNIQTDTGREILVRLDLAPQTAEEIFALFEICDRKCSRILVWSILGREDAESLFIQVFRMATEHPPSFFLELVGRIYLAAPQQGTGLLIRERAKATTILAMDRMGNVEGLKNVVPSVEMLIGISFCLGAVTKLKGLAELTVKWFVQIVGSMKLVEEDVETLGPLMVRILQRLAGNPEVPRIFNTEVGKILGKLHMALRDQDTRPQAERSFKVLKYLMDHQSKVGFPMVALNTALSGVKS